MCGWVFVCLFVLGAGVVSQGERCGLRVGVGYWDQCCLFYPMNVDGVECWHWYGRTLFSFALFTLLSGQTQLCATFTGARDHILCTGESVYLFICLSPHSGMGKLVHLFVCLPKVVQVSQSVCLSVCLPTVVWVSQSICLSVCLPTAVHCGCENVEVYTQIGHQSLTDRVCKMSVWFFSGEEKGPIVFLLAQSLPGYFFFVTHGHRIADPVTGCSPTIQAYIRPINTAAAIYF